MKNRIPPSDYLKKTGEELAAYLAQADEYVKELETTDNAWEVWGALHITFLHMAALIRRAEYETSAARDRQFILENPE